MVLESCDGEIWVPLAGLPGWGLVCGALRVDGGSMAGGRICSTWFFVVP